MRFSPHDTHIPWPWTGRCKWKKCVEKHPSVHVEVADDHLVDVTSHGELLLNLTDTDGDPFTVRIYNVLYVSHFAQNKNTADIVNNFIYLTFIDRRVRVLFSQLSEWLSVLPFPKRKHSKAPGKKLEISGMPHWKLCSAAVVTDAATSSCLHQST
jgi:hypothetical protein